MKKTALLGLLILPFLGISQIYFEFAKPLPPESLASTAPYAHHYGNYKSDKSDIYLELSPIGIYTITN